MSAGEVCRPRQVSSYIVDDDSFSIMFLPCGVVSFDPGEVSDRYCARCHRFIVKNFEPCVSNHLVPDGAAGRREDRQI